MRYFRVHNRMEQGFSRKDMDALERRSALDVRSAPAHELLIILDDVRSMHNVGSAFRTADAFGATGVFLAGYTPCPPHRDIHKTALGAEDTVHWQHFETVSAALDAALDAGYELIAIEQAHQSTPLQRFEPQPGWKYALIFGNEVVGVSDDALRRVQACIEIPQYGAKHSLNISVTVGVVLWELVRGYAAG
jgi:23S rRNA (guanosine2251-2'-O)-methyltransferase